MPSDPKPQPRNAKQSKGLDNTKLKTYKCSICKNDYKKMQGDIRKVCKHPDCYKSAAKKAFIKRLDGMSEKRTNIKPRSDKRAKEERKYSKDRIKFLEDKVCPVTGKPATEVHHMKGRIGKLLLDQRFWLGVSREGHQFIEDNTEYAKKRGWSLNRN